MTPFCFNNEVCSLDIGKGICRPLTFIRHSNYQEMGPVSEHGFM